MKNKIKRISLYSILAALTMFGLVAQSQATPGAKENSLIRKSDGQIFVVKNNLLKKIKNLDELRKSFFGKPIINVDDDTLRQMKLSIDNSGSNRSGSQKLEIKNMGDNTLIRDSRGKIFVVMNGMKSPIHDLIELRREHNGREIHDIDDSKISSIPTAREDNPNRVSGSASVSANNLSEDNPDRLNDDNLPRHSGVDNAFGGRGEIGSGRNRPDSSSDSISSSDSSSGSDDSRGRGRSNSNDSN